MRCVKYCMDVRCSISMTVEMEGLGNMRFKKDRIMDMCMLPWTSVASIIKSLN